MRASHPAQGTVCKSLDRRDVKPIEVLDYLERRAPDFAGDDGRIAARNRCVKSCRSRRPWRDQLPSNQWQIAPTTRSVHLRRSRRAPGLADRDPACWADSRRYRNRRGNNQLQTLYRRAQRPAGEHSCRVHPPSVRGAPRCREFIEKPDTDRDAAVPAHPGAAAFLDNDQKTFFDKYSDYLYFGLMLVSGLGSGAAWLATYARADDRVKSLKVLDRLLDIVKAARAAETVDELVKLREEADSVLGRTICQVQANKLDKLALMAFSLALDQAQLAISDRRSTLTVGATDTLSEASPAGIKHAGALARPTAIKANTRCTNIVPEPTPGAPPFESTRGLRS